jgi:hypothetical protein
MTQFNVPIAFLVFNRPDTTAKVFEAIRNIRPLKLLVVADGPRSSRPEDAGNCSAVRSIIDKVDWPCEVLKNYSEINLGCKKRVSSGLDWVFEQTEEAIILEDDCLPNETFFKFCEEMLSRYCDDERIMMICGTNLSESTSKLDDSYYFSRYPHIWGWASWRRVWCNYDVQMGHLGDLLNCKLFRSSFNSFFEYFHWVKCLKSVDDGRVDTWDAQVTYMAFKTSKLSVFPKQNLITNIGFGTNATHTTLINELANLPSFPMQFPLTHPEKIFNNVYAEKERRIKEGIGIPRIIFILILLFKKLGAR